MKAMFAALIIALTFALPTAASAQRAHAVSPPRNRSTPTLVSVRPGELLHAHAPRGKHVRQYAWLRCSQAGRACRLIPRATHRTYRVRIADVGHRLRVRMVLAGAQGQTVAVSDPTPTILAPLPVNTTLPTISGIAQQGQLLTGTQGTWTNAVSFSYQWLACNVNGANCAPINGATQLTYMLQASDVGDTIRFQVTAYNYQFTGAAADSRTA